MTGNVVRRRELEFRTRGFAVTFAAQEEMRR
jgi:hypothetical protein